MPCHSFRIIVIPSVISVIPSKYCISSCSFLGNYSFLNLEIQRSKVLWYIHKCVETIQGQKLYEEILCCHSFWIIAISNIFILNSSGTLPYSKDEKIGWQSWPYLQVHTAINESIFINHSTLILKGLQLDWYLLPKLFRPTVRKKCSSDQEKLLKFEAKGREFAKLLRSLEQFIQTVKGQNNFRNRMFFFLFHEGFSDLIH